MLGHGQPGRQSMFASLLDRQLLGGPGAPGGRRRGQVARCRALQAVGTAPRVQIELDAPGPPLPPRASRPPPTAAPLPSLCTAVHRLPFVAEFSVEGQCSGTVVNNPGLTGTPAFAAQYSKVRRRRQRARARCSPGAPLPLTRPLSLLPRQVYNGSKLLAIADEEGYVSVVDTSCALPTDMADDWGPNKPRAQWLAHRNAVFDLCWCNVRCPGVAVAVQGREGRGRRTARAARPGQHSQGSTQARASRQQVEAAVAPRLPALPAHWPSCAASPLALPSLCRRTLVC